MFIHTFHAPLVLTLLREMYTVIDACSQYTMFYRCLNEPGELPRLTKKALEEFRSYGVISK